MEDVFLCIAKWEDREVLRLLLHIICIIKLFLSPLSTFRRWEVVRRVRVCVPGVGGEGTLFLRQVILFCFLSLFLWCVRCIGCFYACEEV